MAEGTNGTGATTDEKKPAPPTKRVVLRREQVIVLGDELPAEARDAIVKAIAAVKVKGAKISSEISEAWRVLGPAEAGSQMRAIELYAGTAGTSDAVPGAYKAVALSSWAGGELYEAPPAPLVERKPLEEAIT